ncbi:LPS-assembly protein LptD [Orenia marismortui]|uniref:LPS-assembly protein n=1 Tax=Orenia marismortui TaxID=46469 RepID=A0A4R8HGK7_9FIRM|nr:LPS-assembly protein LptD [Orenia marismortui]TDX59232.1 LPS-assembly protein [Orenia marismortui]
MKKIVTFLLLMLFIYPAIGQAAEEAPFSVEADGFIIYDEETQVIQAENNVIIQLDSDMIKADKIKANLLTKTIEAEGNVVLIEDDNKLYGDGLEYDYQKEEGKIYNGESRQDKISFKGKEINIVKDELVVTDTELTVCDHETPHYKITAEKINVYSNDLVVARGVDLWINDHKIMPLPTYTTSLDPEERKKYAIPEPKIGYSRDDGMYLDVNYDHYVNENLHGLIHVKATSKNSNELDLDYEYTPSENFQFRPDLSYKQGMGVDGTVSLKNKIGDITSNINYNAYIEDDEDDPDYKDKEWLAKWDLSTDIFGIKSGLHFRRDEDDTETGKEITFDKKWSDYYWQLRAGEDNKHDYKPQFSIGIQNKDLGNGTLLSTDLRVAQVYERETDIETSRKELALKLQDSEIKISDLTNLYWSGKVSRSEYGTGDDFETYDFNLGLDQKIAFLDFNLDYQYYNELGETPFHFDLLTDEDQNMGERNYLTASVGSDLKLSDNLDFNWNALARNSYYEDGQEYNYYQFDAKTYYQINEFNGVGLGYNYVGIGGKTPIDDEEVESDDLVNEVSLSYNFQTDELELPYWDVKIETGYDFIDDELSTLKYSFTREFDCFNTGIEYDQLEKDIRFNLKLKY